VVYEVRVAAHNGGQETRFQLELDEAPAKGEHFKQGTMVYEVTRVVPDEAVIEAVWRAGPAQSG
jgi:hypothetical protein